MKTLWTVALLSLSSLGCSQQQLCGPTTVAELPLSLSDDPTLLASGNCVAACQALASAADAQEAVQAAVNCAFVPGTAATLIYDGDGGPAVFCSATGLELVVAQSSPSACVDYGDEASCTTVAVPLPPSNGDGGNCQDVCFASIGDAGLFAYPIGDAGLPLEPEDFTCSVQPGFALTFTASTPVDGGPGVICNGAIVALSSAAVPSLDAGPACQAICLAILGDGGASGEDTSFDGTVPADPPSSCNFEALPDGGPGVLCDWEIPCPSYSNTGGGCGALLTPQPNVFLVILGLALGARRRRGMDR